MSTLYTLYCFFLFLNCFKAFFFSRGRLQKNTTFSSKVLFLMLIFMASGFLYPRTVFVVNKINNPKILPFFQHACCSSSRRVGNYPSRVAVILKQWRGLKGEFWHVVINYYKPGFSFPYYYAFLGKPVFLDLNKKDDDSLSNSQYQPSRRCY